MTSNQKLQSCIVVNFVLLVIITAVVVYFREPSNKYFRIGPQPDLDIIGIKINTWTHYFLFQIFLFIITTTNIYIQEIANPILGFSVYNPGNTEITEFSRLELQFYANTIWLISSLRGVLGILFTISQIDIAFAQVIYGELMTVFTIRFLLLDKKFPEDKHKKSPSFGNLFENLTS